MRAVRYGLIVAIALSTVAFTSTAMAGKNGVPGANQNAPGQVFKSERNDPLAVPGSVLSPGQDFKARKSADPLAVPGSALSPGQQYKQNRESLTPALPPGQTFGTPGNRIPGAL